MVQYRIILTKSKKKLVSRLSKKTFVSEKVFVTDLEEVVEKISECEIYEIAEGKETYLGFLSKKHLVCIIFDNLNYYIRLLFKEESELIKSITTLCESFLEDANSVEKKDLEDLYKYIFKTQEELSESAEFYFLAAAKNIVIEIILFGDNDRDFGFSNIFFYLRYALFFKHISDYEMDQRSVEGVRLRKSIKTSECIRQGNSIIDFLKSDKNLFMV